MSVSVITINCLKMEVQTIDHVQIKHNEICFQLQCTVCLYVYAHTLVDKFNENCVKTLTSGRYIIYSKKNYDCWIKWGIWTMKKEIYDAEGLNPVKFSGTTFTIYLNTKSLVSFPHLPYTLTLKALWVSHTVLWCVPYSHHSKQQLFPISATLVLPHLMYAFLH
jgi:hypothetical protein